MNNGDGSFSIDYKIELSSPEGVELDNYQTVDSKVIDLNRDGFEDIMVFGTRVEPHYSGVFMQIHMNTGEGLFVDETTERLIAIKDRSISDRLNDYSSNFQYFDLNGDGHIDLLNYDNNYISDLLKLNGKIRNKISSIVCGSLHNVGIIEEYQLNIDGDLERNFIKIAIFEASFA